MREGGEGGWREGGGREGGREGVSSIPRNFQFPNFHKWPFITAINCTLSYTRRIDAILWSSKLS